MKYSQLRLNGGITRYVGVALLLMIIIFLSAGSRIQKPPGATKPNIIVILVDDAGYADFGFMGSKDLQTPNLDRLAAGSLRFTDAHVTASVCSPSRAGLLTGKYQQRFGYECNEGDGYTGMDTAQQIIPKLLQQNGYSTAAFGKWHLGYESAQHPLEKGFQYHYGFLGGGRSYFYKADKDDLPGSKNALLENGKQVEFTGYLTDVLGDKAVEYIKANKQHPFFMYWAPNAVHTPMEASEADMQKFAKHPRQKLAAMTFALDRAVGKILAGLKQEGLFENTLIFFLSDNGGANNNQSSNFPLKGFKGNKYEAGHRVPFLLSWPAKVKGGKDFRGLTSSLDIFPTALAAARVTIQPAYGLDGVSLLPFLKPGNQQPHAELFWRKDAMGAVRINQYKLVHVKGLGERLYDLNKDPGETVDLRMQQPGVFANMKKQFASWEKDKLNPSWTEGADWDTVTLMIHDDLMHNRKVRVQDIQGLKKFRSAK